jgi:hypothetical protein
MKKKARQLSTGGHEERRWDVLAKEELLDKKKAM